MKKPALAFSYLRLSSKRQANLGSRETYRDGFRRQIELRDEYLNAHPHLTLDESLSLHDIGVSAYTSANMAKGGTGRLAAFRSMVENGDVRSGSYLLVESLDRLSRAQVNDALELLLALVNRGIVVVTISDGMEYKKGADPTQFLISIVHMMRSFEESDLNSRRLRSTWENKRQKAGEHKLTSRAPAWLQLRNNNFEPVAERVDVVRRIFNELASGIGREKIASRLNQDGIACWGHGKSWHGGTVQKITDNLAVVGQFQPHKLVFEEQQGVRVSKRVPVGEPILDYFPTVIEPELWYRARKVAAERSLAKPSNSAGRKGKVLSNIFGPIARCGVCGSVMNYRDRGPRSSTILRCSSERSGSCTNNYRFPYEITENIILSWVVNVDVSNSSGEDCVVDYRRKLEALQGESYELHKQANNIVREIGAGNRFGVTALREIEFKLNSLDSEMESLNLLISANYKSEAASERLPAVVVMINLLLEKANDTEIFAARSRVRQILGDTIKSMSCNIDGNIIVVTKDGSQFLFKDGRWWHDEKWIPSALSFFGLTPRSGSPRRF